MQNLSKVDQLRWLLLGLALLWLGVMACGSQEGAKEAAKEKAPPAAAPPAAGVSAPKTAQEHIDQGKEFLKSKQYDQAIASFNEALKLDPKSTAAYNNRGITYCEQGVLDKALADFSQVIDIDPKNAKAYNNRAVAYMMKGDKEKARQDVAKAQSLGLEVNPVLIENLKPEAAQAGAPAISPLQEQLPPGVTITPVRPEDLPKPGAKGKGEKKK